LAEKPCGLVCGQPQHVVQNVGIYPLRHQRHAAEVAAQFAALLVDVFQDGGLDLLPCLV